MILNNFQPYWFYSRYNPTRVTCAYFHWIKTKLVGTHLLFNNHLVSIIQVFLSLNIDGAVWYVCRTICVSLIITLIIIANNVLWLLFCFLRYFKFSFCILRLFVGKLCYSLFYVPKCNTKYLWSRLLELLTMLQNRLYLFNFIKSKAFLVKTLDRLPTAASRMAGPSHSFPYMIKRLTNAYRKPRSHEHNDFINSSDWNGNQYSFSSLFTSLQKPKPETNEDTWNKHEGGNQRAKTKAQSQQVVGDKNAI